MRQLKNAVTAIAALAALSGASLAAKAADFSEANMNWTGVYLGVDGGFGKGGGDTHYGASGDPALQIDGSGWVAGAHVGMNWEFPNHALFGVEASYAGTGIKGSGEDTFDPGTGTTTVSETQTIDTLGMFKARMGLAAGVFLPYVTGGVAFAKSTRTVSPSYSASKTFTGWTLGGGAEVALGRHWSVRGEYDYADLGTQNFSLPSAGGGYDVHLTASIVTGAINYHW